MPGINQREDLAHAAVRCCLGRYPAPASPPSLRLCYRFGRTNVARKRDSPASVIWLQRFPVESAKRKVRGVRDCTRCNCVESG